MSETTDKVCPDFRRRGRWCAGLAALALIACTEAEPVGQVVVSVGGDDITMAELRHEIASDPSLTQDSALERLIERKTLAAHAVSLGLERDAGFHFDARRGREDLLVETLRRDLKSRLGEVEPRDLWIAINAQPWRYSERVRLYLSRTLDNGERAVAWVDTDNFVEAPPVELMAAEPGDVVSLNGQEWNVEIREIRVVSPDEMLAKALAEWQAGELSRSEEQILAQRRALGQTRYQAGFGPAGAGIDTPSTD